MRKMRKRKAFTLVEMLISLIITGLVMAAVTTLFFSVFKSYELQQDIVEAKQRGQIALASIQPFIMNAGVGLPPGGGADFRKGFEWYDVTNARTERLSVLFPEVPTSTEAWKNFSDFLQLAESEERISTDTDAPALWVVYSVSSGNRINQGLEAFEGVRTVDNATMDSELLTSKSVAMSGSIDSQQLSLDYPPTTLKSWVVFPSSIPPSPFTVTSGDVAGSVKFRSHSSSENNMIAPFDELHYVRAVKIYVENNVLKVNRLDGSGAQTVADGIVGMWCSFDPDGDRILTVYMLARASTKRTPDVQGTIVGWPVEAATHWQSVTDDSYRHAVVSRSWRIRN
ncbi:MAG: type II secretion system protein [Bacteroidia bacterium]|nr:type II secretion system protein [Bacteroidia bacterium]